MRAAGSPWRPFHLQCVAQRERRRGAVSIPMRTKMAQYNCRNNSNKNKKENVFFILNNKDIEHGSPTILQV